MNLLYISACFAIGFVAQAYFSYKIVTKILAAKAFMEGNPNAARWIDRSAASKVSMLENIKEKLKGTKEEEEFSVDNLPMDKLNPKKNGKKG